MHIDTGINQELKPPHPRRPSLPGLVTKGRREELVYFINVHSMSSGCPAVVMSRTSMSSEPKVSPKFYGGDIKHKIR